MSAFPTVWQTIMAAASRGAGLVLSSDQVRQLAGDETVLRRAALDNEDEARARAAYAEALPEPRRR